MSAVVKGSGTVVGKDIARLLRHEMMAYGQACIVKEEEQDVERRTAEYSLEVAWAGREVLEIHAAALEVCHTCEMTAEEEDVRQQHR